MTDKEKTTEWPASWQEYNEWLAKLTKPASKPAKDYYVRINWTKGDHKGSSCQYTEAMSKSEASKLAKSFNKELASDCQYRFEVSQVPACKRPKRVLHT